MFPVIKKSAIASWAHSKNLLSFGSSLIISTMFLGLTHNPSFWKKSKISFISIWYLSINLLNLVLFKTYLYSSNISLLKHKLNSFIKIRVTIKLGILSFLMKDDTKILVSITTFSLLLVIVNMA